MTDSPNLMLAKVSHYMVCRNLARIITTTHTSIAEFSLLAILSSFLEYYSIYILNIHRTFNHIGVAAYQLFILLTTENYPVRFF